MVDSPLRETFLLEMVARGMCNLQEYAQHAAARRTPLLCRCDPRRAIAPHSNLYIQSKML